jgi:hypothetical protein
MTGRSRKSAINSYVVAVAVTGSAILLYLAVTGGASALAYMPPVFWLLCLYMVVGEFRYIVLPRTADLESITTTTCLCLTLLLGWGLAPAALVVAASSIVSDLLHRKELRKVVFNGGQYTIAVTAGGLTLLVLGARPPFDVDQLPAFFVAAAIYLFVNKTLVGIVVAMHRGMPVNLQLWSGAQVEILPEAILVALAPLVLVGAAAAADDRRAYRLPGGHRGRGQPRGRRGVGGGGPGDRRRAGPAGAGGAGGRAPAPGK